MQGPSFQFPFLDFPRRLQRASLPEGARFAPPDYRKKEKQSAGQKRRTQTKNFPRQQKKTGQRNFRDNKTFQGTSTFRTRKVRSKSTVQTVNFPDSMKILDASKCQDPSNFKGPNSSHRNRQGYYCSNGFQCKDTAVSCRFYCCNNVVLDFIGRVL